MNMQVGLKTPTGISPSPLQGGNVSKSGAVTPTVPVQNRTQQEFPDSPLISTRPVRYNVLLNEQLTAVQQADVYLRNVESQLLQLRHAVDDRKESGTLAQRSESVNNLIENRQNLSGGTVDRQFKVSVEGKTRIGFVLPDVQALLQSTEEETLIFSLGGQKRELTAVKIDAGSSPDKIVRRLNLGLGRWDVHAQIDAQQNVTFSAGESRWERLSTQLSVKGEGIRYPADQFYPLKPLASADLVDKVQDIAARPAVRSGDLDSVLEQVTQQRRRLIQSKDLVRQKIESMATFSESGSALMAAAQLKERLAGAAGEYSTLSQALSAQANVRPQTVKNLLG